MAFTAIMLLAFALAAAVQARAEAANDCFPPPPSAGEAWLAECYQVPPVEADNTVEETTAFCLSCHAADPEGQESAGPERPRIDPRIYGGTFHAGVSCTTCHVASQSYPHKEQVPVACTSCHDPHSELTAHDAHIDVACQACHLNGADPVREEETGRILWTLPETGNGLTNVHSMSVTKAGEESCLRCHDDDNPVGAATTVLPAKGLACMACHAGTLSVEHPVNFLPMAVLIFGLGLILVLAINQSAFHTDDEDASTLGRIARGFKGVLGTVFSGRSVPIARELFHDLLLQRRLYRRSRVRWFIHALIFYPFLLRFAWGLAGMVLTSWLPEWELGFGLVNKNNPLTAFAYDLTGLAILAGVVLALLRGFRADRGRIKGLPPQDRIALLLIGAAVVVGFVLEGMRIAMTMSPPMSGAAFAGKVISMFFSAQGAAQAYGTIWYLHAILWGAFVAYLPFSRILHIVMAPVSLALRASSSEHHGEN